MVLKTKRKIFYKALILLDIYLVDTIIMINAIIYSEITKISIGVDAILLSLILPRLWGMA